MPLSSISLQFINQYLEKVNSRYLTVGLITGDSSHLGISLTSSTVSVLSEIQACGNLGAFKSINIYLQKALHTVSGSVVHFVLSVRSDLVSTVRGSSFRIHESNRCPVEPITVSNKNHYELYDNMLSSKDSFFPKTAFFQK